MPTPNQKRIGTSGNWPRVAFYKWELAVFVFAGYASATIVRLLDLSVRPDNSAAFDNWAVFSIMQRHWTVDRCWLAIFHVRETSTSEHRDPCTLRMHAAHTLCELSTLHWNIRQSSFSLKHAATDRALSSALQPQRPDRAVAHVVLARETAREHIAESCPQALAASDLIQRSTCTVQRGCLIAFALPTPLAHSGHTRSPRPSIGRAL